MERNASNSRHYAGRKAIAPTFTYLHIVRHLLIRQHKEYADFMHTPSQIMGITFAYGLCTRSIACTFGHYYCMYGRHYVASNATLEKVCIIHRKQGVSVYITHATMFGRKNFAICYECDMPDIIFGIK